MAETVGKTGAWIGTEYILGAAKLKIYNYDGNGRVHCVSTLVVPRRTLRQLIRKIDENDESHEQDAFPF